MIPALFISGTGTGVGKTLFTSLFGRYLAKQKISCQIIKIVQTGARNLKENDSLIYSKAIEDLSSQHINFWARTLYSYNLAASPHLAARQQGHYLTSEMLAENINNLKKNKDYELLLVEGSGGLLVPINEQESFLDLIHLLQIPIIIVTCNKLGMINDVLLSCNAAKHEKIMGLVLNSPENTNYDTIILNDNEKFLKQKFRYLPILSLPWIPAVTTKAWDSLLERASQFCSTIFKKLTTQTEPSDFIRRDHNTLWHPYASVIQKPQLESITSTHENKIVSHDGCELIDGMSSWWAAIHGYNHPYLLHALEKQSQNMPHIMFGGITHEPAITLGERLLERLPKGLSRIFFADSGSVAVEVALKMAIQYQKGYNKPNKTRFLTPRGGYHGDTLGAMSVCDPHTGMHKLFNGLLPQQIFMPRPSCRFDSSFDDSSLNEPEKIFAKYGKEIAAVILEPIVQGAGGMWFYHPNYLIGIANLCRKYECLLIFDEIATGFGRTGKFFAAEWAGVTPDILCLGKALTGGCLTLAATACTENVAQGICQNGLPFMHGPTFMANPLACAVANASLDLLEQNFWPSQVAHMEKKLKELLLPLKSHSDVKDVRCLGAIGVVEMISDVNLSKLQKFCVKRGIWLRPFKNLIYLMPPYITPDKDLEKLALAIEDAINSNEWRL